MPVALDGPLAAEIIELPLPAVSVTVLPLTGLLFASVRVTVIVEVVVPSAGTDDGLWFTVETEALTAPVLIVAIVAEPVAEPLVAVTVKLLPATVGVTLALLRT